MIQVENRLVAISPSNGICVNKWQPPIFLAHALSLTFNSKIAYINTGRSSNSLIFSPAHGYVARNDGRCCESQ